MPHRAGSPTPGVEWGAAIRPLRGQTESGDLYVVSPWRRGVVLAAIDGLGHGRESAAAARTAGAAVEQEPDGDVLALLTRAHQAARRTRGAVMSIAALDTQAHLLSWCGVGNVEGVLLRSNGSEILQRESLMLRAGVLGDRLPPIQAAVLPVSYGDILVFATDGVRRGFLHEAGISGTAQQMADEILGKHATGMDDALVLVARYIGGDPPP